MYLLEQLPENERNDVRKVMRYLEERILIESLYQPTDMVELRKEIGLPTEDTKTKIRKPTKKDSRIAKKQIDIYKKTVESESLDNSEIMIPRKVNIDDPQVAYAFSEMDELRKLIDKPFSEIYKREISGVPKNRFMPIRMLKEFLELGDFDANELAFLTKLIKQIVQYNKGSIERVLTCLYIELELSKKYQL